MKKTCVRLASLGALLLNSSLAMEIVTTYPLDTNHKSPSSEFITLDEWPKEILNMIQLGANTYRLDNSESQNKLENHLKETQKSKHKTFLRITQVFPDPDNPKTLNNILSEHDENINYLFIKLHPHYRDPKLPKMLKNLPIIENLDGLGIEYKKLESGHLAQIKNLTIMKNYTKYALTPGEEFVVFFKNGVTERFKNMQKTYE